MKGLIVVGVALITAACATAPLLPSPRDAAAAAAIADFSFSTDTFAFPNQIRALTPDADYANYCFVLARSLRQFHQFARFEPRAARLRADEYEERVREVVARPPWEPALPPAARVVIPGYATLREFSADQERAVKAGLGGRLWTFVHWTNWRVSAPLPDGHQEAVAAEIEREIRAGRLVQLLVTNWPKPELNHTVVAYAYRDTERGVEFTMWDPNNPAQPGLMLFQRDQERFWATRVYETRPGVIRAFRMYTSWML